MDFGIGCNNFFNLGFNLGPFHPQMIGTSSLNLEAGIFTPETNGNNRYRVKLFCYDISGALPISVVHRSVDNATTKTICYIEGNLLNAKGLVTMARGWG